MPLRKRSPVLLSIIVVAVISTSALAAAAAASAPADPTRPASADDRWDAADPTTVWLGIDREPLPFSNALDVVEFLTEARIVAVVKVLDGSTRPRKVLLELDGIRAHGIFRDVDRSETRVKLDDGSFHMRLRDYDLFEVAAYRLATLLGMDNVPPTVKRRFAGKTGSLQLWVENVISSGDLRDGMTPPDYAQWGGQMQTMELFDYLITNIDRNTGNYLFDENWKLWMIDHTRAFQITERLPDPHHVQRCAPATYAILLGLDEAALVPVFEGLLTDLEVSHLLGRIRRLRAHLELLIEERGFDVVIF